MEDIIVNEIAWRIFSKVADSRPIGEVALNHVSINAHGHKVVHVIERPSSLPVLSVGFLSGFPATIFIRNFLRYDGHDSELTIIDLSEPDAFEQIDACVRRGVFFGYVSAITIVRYIMT
jgi:hypothetical protein